MNHLLEPKAGGMGSRKTTGSASLAAHDPFWLGRKLVSLKRITAQELQSAIDDFRRRPSEPFVRALERLSLASQRLIAQLTADHFALESVEIAPGQVPTDLVKRLPVHRARHFGVVPYREEK